MFNRTTRLFTITVIAVVVLTSCGKKDDVPGSNSGTPPATAVVASHPAAAPLAPGVSPNLTRNPTAPMYHLDKIGTANDPVGQKSSQISGDASILIMGWAADGPKKTVAGGVDVVLDGTPFIAKYGTGRNDVADAFKRPEYLKSGFELLLSPGQLTKGEHSLSIRVISSDQKSYWQGEVVKFVVT